MSIAILFIGRGIMAYLRLQMEENKQKIFNLEPARVSIGRFADNDLVINDGSVSKHHARLNFEDNYFLTDLRSSNGTYINGKKILHVKLASGDVINFAGFNATFYE